MLFKYSVFKSRWKDDIYDSNAHEPHHKVLITSGKLMNFSKWSFVKEVCLEENMVRSLDAVSVVVD